MPEEPNPIALAHEAANLKAKLKRAERSLMLIWQVAAVGNFARDEAKTALEEMSKMP